MARPIKLSKKNINVFQSFIMTTAHYKFSIDEKRIIYRLIEIAQSEIKGIKLNENIRPLYRQETLFDGMEITLPITSILDVVTDDGSKSKHYDRIKKALDSLEEKKIYFEDLDGTWEKERFIHRPKVTPRTGNAICQVAGWFWDLILNFSKGYTKYELFTAMRLKSIYSMRFYELMSGQKNMVFEYSIDEMRDIFGLDGKYTRPSSIKERIIDPARKELDAVAPYSFDVEDVRTGDKKTSPITGFKFIPRKNEENQDKELQEKEHLAKLTARNSYKYDETYEILKYDYGFTASDQNKNKPTITEGEKVIPNFPDFLRSIKEQKSYKNLPQKPAVGWIVNTIKKKTKEIKEKKQRVQQYPTNQEIKPGDPISVTPSHKDKYKNKW